MISVLFVCPNISLEVTAMEELELDLIRVPSFPGSIFRYHLLYKAGNATGIVGAYSYDDDWYYLYKKDSEKYKVKRRRDLELKKPEVIYRQRRIYKSPDVNRKLGGVEYEKVAEIGGSVVMENNHSNDEIQKHFGDRFMETSDMNRFEVLIDHFSKKFSISRDQAMEAYEKTSELHDQGKVEKFAGYFAALCKGKSTREYTPEQEQKYMEYHIKMRKDEQLIDFMIRYENGERRVFAPHFGITKKEHNEMVYDLVKKELESRMKQQAVQDKSREPDIGMP
jgi:hypothetical protein